MADARRDVAAALAFAPPHLSFYHLTLEPNTLFHRYPPPLPDDDAAADIEDAVLQMLRRCRLRALRDVRAREAATRMPAQRQLLALRRLSRHRRGRAFEAVVSGSHRAAAALEAAEAVSRAGRSAARRCRRNAGFAAGSAVRVHAECAAPDRRRSRRAVRRAHGMPLSIAARPIAEATRKGLLDARSGDAQADAARPAVPERSAGAVSRGWRGGRPCSAATGRCGRRRDTGNGCRR